ncbi:MAG: TrmJ/YjtD family RNA methyltransferase [Candidatus Aminicenantes bacterium]|nr:TrmJ/YjtD family RNA methyltransferase [Candidatus Aminicenantes bacterium]
MVMRTSPEGEGEKGKGQAFASPGVLYYNFSVLEATNKKMKDILERIHVVLVEPKNAGNIGSVVRAMKNMGLSRLHLVNPVPFRDEVEQRKMGYRSQEIIAAAHEFTSLSEALHGISQVFLATAKKGKWKKDFLSPAQAAARIAAGPAEKIALVFGREDKGVTTDESQSANYFIRIPMAGTYPSLNLSQAVMVVTYELYKAVQEGGQADGLPRMAEKRAFERLTENIWNLMKSLELREPENGLFHRSLKRALNRTRWTNADVAVFDRFCKQMRWFAEKRCCPPQEEDK